MDGREESIGANIRRIRRWRGMSQEVAAGLAGLSKGYWSRIENGHAAVDRRSTLAAIANALQIAPREILALPVPAPGNGGTDGVIDEIRRTLLAVNIEQPGGNVESAESLRQRISEARRVRRAGQFRDVGSVLPALIRDLHSSIAAGSDKAELLEMAVDLHVHITLMWLRDAGAPLDLRWQAASIARDTAQERDEPYTLGVACYGVANTLFAASAFDLAQAELDALPTLSTTDPNVPLIGMLAMTSAIVAASDNRLGEVSAPMDQAAELAERVGEDHGPASFGFGPTNVGLWKMALALESGEPDRAISIANDIEPRNHPFATRPTGSTTAEHWHSCRVAGRRRLSRRFARRRIYIRYVCCVTRSHARQ